jgi:hypothetical protein
MDSAVVNLDFTTLVSNGSIFSISKASCSDNILIE